MKHLIAIFSLVFFLFPLNYNTEADQIVGIWFTENSEAKVEIYKKEKKYFGKIIWSKSIELGEADGIDSKNPNENLRNRKLIGLNILSEFEYNGNNVWEDGEVYDPENGKTYRCKITLQKDKKTLNVRGFIGFSLMGRTTVWRKAE